MDDFPLHGCPHNIKRGMHEFMISQFTSQVTPIRVLDRKLRPCILKVLLTALVVQLSDILWGISAQVLK